MWVRASTLRLGSSDLLKKISDFLNEYLRFNAIRRMLTYVDIKKSEIFGLIAFAVAFALFEGISLSLLLPILQFAEGSTASSGQGGQTAILASSGPFWRALASMLEFLHLPPTLPVLLFLAFIPILLRQVVFYYNTWYSAVVSGRIALQNESADAGHGLVRGPRVLRPPFGRATW